MESKSTKLDPPPNRCAIQDGGMRLDFCSIEKSPLLDIIILSLLHHNYLQGNFYQY
jgi:hypothetical protein